MPITTKELAQMLGVSRATVDRALHNRGRVSPQMKQRIEEAAREYGYEPAAMGRALALARNPVRIGVVIHLAQLPFFRQVREGVDAATAELANLGGVVLVEELPDLDPARHIAAVERLVEQGVKGLAVTPVDDAGFKALLCRLMLEQNIEVVTLNAAVSGLGGACFVGLDNHRSGRTAAGLMDLMLGAAGGQVLVMSGNMDNRTNSQRVDGFTQTLAEDFPAIEVAGVQFNGDDEDTAFRIVQDSLAKYPALRGLFMVSGGQAGACRALEEAGRADMRVVVYDTVPDTVRYIEQGIIDFIIDQHAFEQGSLPPRLLFDSLFSGKKPTKEQYYTEISIKTRFNL